MGLKLAAQQVIEQRDNGVLTHFVKVTHTFSFQEQKKI